MTPLDTVEIWYPDEGIWKEDEALPDVRFGAAMVILDGMPTLLGGSNNVRAKDNVYAYNYTTPEWIVLKKRLRTPRASAGFVTVPETLYSQCHFKR